MNKKCVPGQDSAETWRARTFLGVGALWLVGGVVEAVHESQVVDEILGIHLGSIFIVLVFLAMIGTLPALLGLYARLADRTPRLALAGTASAAFPAVGNVVFYLAGIVVVFFPAYSGIIQETPLGTGLGVVWAVGAVLYPVGPAAFGVGTLRTDAFSPRVGYLLVVPVALWAVMVGSVVLRQNLGGGVGTGVSLLLGVDFLAIGYLLRSTSPRGDPPEQTSE